MKKQIFVLFVMTIIASVLLSACAPAPTVPGATEPPATEAQVPTGESSPEESLPAPGVAILVLDDFVDEVQDLSNIQFPDPEKVKEELTAGGNCVYNISGQAATISTGAAATISTGAGVMSLNLPAPHGDIVFEELSSIINRDPANSQDGPPTDGSEIGSSGVVKAAYFTNLASQQRIALVAIDTSNYTTDVIVDNLDQAIQALEAQGYQRFVINMSFVIMPCPDIDEDPDITFDIYQQIIDQTPELGGLQEYLSSLKGGDNFINQTGEVIEEADAAIRLAFDPNLGPLRLRAFYDAPEYEDGKEKYASLLSDSLYSYLIDLPSHLQIIPVASAGNQGLPYPYAPAMWNPVLSVNSPTVVLDAQELGLLSPPAEPTYEFHFNSGEVTAEGCTDYQGQQRVPGTSFAAPKVSYLAALYLLQGGSVDCIGSLNVSPITTLGYAEDDGNWQNLTVDEAAVQYCTSFPPNNLGGSCP